MPSSPLSLMCQESAKRSIAVCETQPVTAEGIRSLLAGSGDLECRWVLANLPVCLQVVRQQPVDVLIVDKALGISSVLGALAELRRDTLSVNIVIWGNSMSESEALRLLQAGARGLLRKSADLPAVLGCIRAVASGQTWLEDCVFREGGASLERHSRSDLTSREQQVLELVEQGMKNREIARELGIRPGTVKIHLKHIFEKTGVHGRYGLALNGMRQRGLFASRSAEALQKTA